MAAHEGGDGTNRYASPAPLPRAFTPPPSSQGPHINYSNARTPTPTHSHLSSPPPTVKAHAPQDQPMFDPERPSKDSEGNEENTKDTLKTSLAEANVECKTAKGQAAHYRLQYELLSIEYSKAKESMDVELEMAKKEVAVAQAGHRREQPEYHLNHAATESVLLRENAHLKLQYESLQAEHTRLLRRLDDAAAVIVERENALNEEIERLRQRIRDNRTHMNQLRMSENTLYGTPGPVLEYGPIQPNPGSTPRVQNAKRPTSHGQGAFDALLDASKYLSQEGVTVPSNTTSRKTGVRENNPRSLPTTPNRPIRGPNDEDMARNTVHDPYRYKRTGRNFWEEQTNRSSRPVARAEKIERRHESRDSTISASDTEEADGNVGGSNTTIYTSPASQEAANLLRKSSNSFRKCSTRPSAAPTGLPTSSVGSKQAPMKQSRVKTHNYQIAKPSTPDLPTSHNELKRRFFDGNTAKTHSGSPRTPKKQKTSTAEGIGLGISG